MDRALVRPRPLAASLVVLACVVLAQLTVLATAASAESRPSVTISAPDVDGGTVTFDFSVNRSAKAIASAVCTLTDDSEVETVVGCGTAAAGATRQETDFEVTVANLVGDHVFEVAVTLTDGGTATSSEPVTVEPAEPVEFADARTVCEALDGGFFVVHLYWWQTWNCDFDAASSEVVAASRSVLLPLCLADGGIHFAEVGTVPGAYTFGCWNL